MKVERESVARKPITVRLSPVEIELLQRSARDRNMTASDVLRTAFVEWRERQGDRQAALEAWVDGLLERYDAAVMCVTVDDHSLDECRVQIDGEDVTHDVFSGVVYDAVDGRLLAQLWVGDLDSDARAFVGRVPPVHGAGVTIPVRALAGMGASDAEAV